VKLAYLADLIMQIMETRDDMTLYACR